MFKVMWLMKRKAGTSMQDLIDYYESTHSVLGAKLFKENNFRPVKYMRKYLHPMGDPMSEGENSRETEPEYDVAMEMWFHSREDFDRLVEFASSEAVADMIIADERRFLDRERRAVFILEEHETHFG
ncbi:EthD domain-containing protein [Rhizorhapis suberifaciens]|nr:EthD domain-containing protein [Rhizorhapis suberifaciens]